MKGTIKSNVLLKPTEMYMDMNTLCVKHPLKSCIYTKLKN